MRVWLSPSTEVRQPSGMGRWLVLVSIAGWLTGCGGLGVVCAPGEYKISGIDNARCMKPPGAACTSTYQCLSWGSGGGCDGGVCSCIEPTGICIKPSDCCSGQCTMTGRTSGECS